MKNSEIIVRVAAVIVISILLGFMLAASVRGATITPASLKTSKVVTVEGVMPIPPASENQLVHTADKDKLTVQ